MKKKIILTLIICLSVIFVMAACNPKAGNDGRTKYDTPSMELFDAEVTADSIEIICDKFYDEYKNGEVLQFSLPNGDWQDSPLFEGLLPNTLYDIRIRIKEDKDHKASNFDYYSVSTAKKEAAVLPEHIDYTQENRTVTVEKNDAWEYCFTEDDRYRNANSYTYGSEDDGERIIKVRTKGDESINAGDPYEIKVYISGYYNGSGTEEDPFLIYTVEHFNSRKTVSKTNNVHIKLMNDLDFTNAVIRDCNKLGDSFDGNGHKISNAKITRAITGEYIVKNYAGIFTQIKEIKNLTAENIVIELAAEKWDVNYSVGLIAGGAQVVDNCRASGRIVLNDEYSKRGVCGIGGLVGEMGCTKGDVIVNNSYADVSIAYESTTNTKLILRVGGLFGAGVDGYVQTLKVSQSAANIDVDLKGFVTSDDRYTGVGGLIGDTKEGSIENCYASGNIKTNGAGGKVAVGGLTAAVYSTYESYRCIFPNIKNCYSTVNMDIDGTNQTVVAGGVNPMMHSKTGPKTVDNCLFAGNISITNLSDRSAAGSVYGKDCENITVSNCYNINTLADYVDVSMSTAVDEATIKSVVWQRETLKLSEEYWELVEGKYPELK